MAYIQVNANETSYQDVEDIMTNSMEEFFHKTEVKKRKKYFMRNYITKYCLCRTG